jgi:hypothetical protein
MHYFSINLGVMLEPLKMRFCFYRYNFCLAEMHMVYYAFYNRLLSIVVYEYSIDFDLTLHQTNASCSA